MYNVIKILDNVEIHDPRQQAMTSDKAYGLRDRLQAQSYKAGVSHARVRYALRYARTAEQASAATA